LQQSKKCVSKDITEGMKDGEDKEKKEGRGEGVTV